MAGAGFTDAGADGPPLAGRKRIAVKKKNLCGIVKLDPLPVNFQIGDLLGDAMSYIQSLQGAKVNLSVEVHVKVPNGAKNSTAQIVLKNSRSLKVDSCSIY